MGKGFHLGAVASLLLAFVQAPLQHAHASDPHHEHAQGSSHAHWSDHRSDTPAWEAEDHGSDARLLDWLGGDGTSLAKFVAAMPESLVTPVLPVRTIQVPELTTRNHDPPWRRCLHPRAPPA